MICVFLLFYHTLSTLNEYRLDLEPFVTLAQTKGLQKKGASTLLAVHNREREAIRHKNQDYLPREDSPFQKAFCLASSSSGRRSCAAGTDVNADSLAIVLGLGCCEMVGHD